MNYTAGTQFYAGLTVATVLPDLDFETYSEAGFLWDESSGKFKAPLGATKKGLGVVGAAVYAEHPSTEILCLSYDLKDGVGARSWRAGDPPPQPLFDHIARGGLLCGHNVAFEHRIWNVVAVRKLGWPPLPQVQLRCSMAKARAYSLPGALGNLAEVLRVPIGKDKDGKKQLERFSWPRYS